MSIQNTVTLDDVMNVFKSFNTEHVHVSNKKALESALKKEVKNVMATNGKAQVSLVIDLGVEKNGMLTVDTSVVTKSPKPGKGKAICYGDSRGNLYLDDPTAEESEAEVTPIAREA